MAKTSVIRDRNLSRINCLVNEFPINGTVVTGNNILAVSHSYSTIRGPTEILEDFIKWS